MSKNSNLPPYTCASCSTVLDVATVIYQGEAHPHWGDLSICLSCGQVALFTQGARLDPIPARELDPLLAGLGVAHQIRPVLEAIRYLNSCKMLWYVFLYLIVPRQ